MEYSKLVAVSGLPGLFELINSKNDGAIVRSLDDKTTRFVSSRIHNFSHLESIEIYTVRDNVNLVDVLNTMGASSEKLPDEKDNGAVKKYFETVYPDMDFDRVYASDMKKIVKWSSILTKNNVEIKLSEAPEEEEEEVAVEEVKETTPKKKAAAEKTEEPVAKKTPAKKAAPKKKEAAEDSDEPVAKKTPAKKAAPKKK